MDRRRFLIAAAATSFLSAAPYTVFAKTASVAQVRILRWPREVLFGEPGRCAGTRRSGNLTAARMLSLR
jgi:hypothetical protein